MAAMQLTFDVGTQETHRVIFSFDKFTGRLTITVDGVPVTRELHMLSASLVKRYQFAVGVNERHDIVIEKHRKLLFAGFRPQLCRAFVDGQLVAEGTA
jgi:hypothetical protein